MTPDGTGGLGPFPGFLAEIAVTSAVPLARALLSKARSSRTSMPGPSRCSSRRAGGLVPIGPCAERGAEQAAGAGLGQRHQPQRGVAGHAQPVADLA